MGQEDELFAPYVFDIELTSGNSGEFFQKSGLTICQLK
jgi:hypothetical protein